MTEQIKWQNNDAVLKKIVDGTELFSFELDDLIKDDLVKSIWCKNDSDSEGLNEKFYQVPPDEVDLSPLSWEKVDITKGLLYAVVRHYMVVVSHIIWNDFYKKVAKKFKKRFNKKNK